MRLALGDPVTALLQAPADPPPNYGARIEVPYTRAIVSSWQEAAINLQTNIWTVTLEPPVDAGDYLLVWRSGDNEEVPEVFIPLSVDVPGTAWPAAALPSPDTGATLVLHDDDGYYINA